MSRELARAKERYKTDTATACRIASLRLIPRIGVDFHITGWTARCRQAYSDEWSGDQFDWPAIFRRHNDPDRLDMAIWTPDNRLAALALCLTTGRAVELRFVEGQKDDDCPLKRYRVMIALEVAACYAQLRGKPELRVTPINDRVRALYVDSYGFEEVRPQREQPYLRLLV